MVSGAQQPAQQLQSGPSSSPPTCPNLYPSPEGVHVRIGEGWKLLRWESLKSFLLKPENTAHLPEDDVVKQTALFLMRREASQADPQPLVQSSVQSTSTSASQCHFQTQERGSPVDTINKSDPKSGTVSPPESDEAKSYSGGKAKVRKGKIIITSVHGSSDEGRSEPYPTKNQKMNTEITAIRGKKRAKPKHIKSGGK